MPVILEQLYSKNVGKSIIYDGIKIYPYDKLIVPKDSVVRLKFVNKISKYREGLIMKVEGSIMVENKKVKSVNFWYDGNDKYVDIKVDTGKNGIFLCNNWKDEKDIIYSLRGNNGMKVEVVSPKCRRYFCNFGFDVVDFGGMVFELDLLSDGEIKSEMD